MSNKVELIDLGLKDYKEVLDLQRKLFNENIKLKLEGSNFIKNYLIFCEHPNVFTLGKNGKLNNLLVNQDFLQKINSTFYHIERGGDITYHGPGQLVCYPIFNLQSFNIGIKQFVYNLEECIIQTLNEFDVYSQRFLGNQGIWIDIDKPERIRKICSIGIKASHFITMHGLAFNINTDIKYFDYINPCGFKNISITSMAIETQKEQDFNNVKAFVLCKLSEIFNFKI